MPGILDSPRDSHHVATYNIKLAWYFRDTEALHDETHKNNLFRNEIYKSDKTRQMSPGNLRGNYFSNVPNKYGNNEK